MRCGEACRGPGDQRRKREHRHRRPGRRPRPVRLGEHAAKQRTGGPGQPEGQHAGGGVDPALQAVGCDLLAQRDRRERDNHERQVPQADHQCRREPLAEHRAADDAQHGGGQGDRGHQPLAEPARDGREHDAAGEPAQSHDHPHETEARVAAGAYPQNLVHPGDELAEERRRGGVGQPGDERRRAYQPVAEQEPQAFPDVADQVAARRRLAAVKRSQDSPHEQRRGDERDRIERDERCRCDQHEERAGHRRHGHLDGGAAAVDGRVRGGQALPAGERRKRAEVGAVEEDVQGLGGEGRREHVRRGEHAEGVRHGDAPERGGAAEVGADHQPAPVEPVGDGTGDQPEAQVRQGLGDRHEAGPQVGAGHLVDQHGQRDIGHHRAGAGDHAGYKVPAELPVPAERLRHAARRRHAIEATVRQWSPMRLRGAGSARGWWT